MAAVVTDAQVPRPAIDLERLKRIGRELLEAIGEDPERDGLLGTPERFAHTWREFVEYAPGRIDTLFEAHGGQMVIVSPIRIWSYCEHHLMPFWCDVSIAYIPSGQVLGLSKFARIAHKIAHRLQIQERLVWQIADEIQSVTGAPDVMVMARGVHLCMVMRGIQTSGVMTSTSARGRFEADSTLRAEFLQAVQDSAQIPF